MKTIDHYLLGEKILKEISLHMTKFEKEVFLLGCEEPDINPFTYLKGSIKYEKFHGHNYNNSKKLIKNYIKKLESGHNKWKILKYYRLGKLIHYIADAFTFTHNDLFQGSLREHVAYERYLHCLIIKELEKGEIKRMLFFNRTGEDIYEKLSKIHNQYLQKRKKMYDDMMYIYNVCLYIVMELTEGSSSERVKACCI